MERQYHDVQTVNTDRQKQLDKFHSDLDQQRQVSEQFQVDNLRKRNLPMTGVFLLD